MSISTKYHIITKHILTQLIILSTHEYPHINIIMIAIEPIHTITDGICCVGIDVGRDGYVMFTNVHIQYYIIL